MVILKIMFNKYAIACRRYFLLLPILPILSILSLSASANLNLELPELEELTGGSVATATAQDNGVGLKLLRKMRRHLPIIEDPELNQWIISMGQRLARSAGASGKLYFLLVENPDVNASAYDGGVVLINTGLVLYTDSESELAAVIAHEIAHITQHHLARMRSGSSGSLLGTSAAILAGLAVGSQSPDAGTAIVTSALALQQHQQLAFTRSMESEADRIGIRTLARAGFKASGMPALQEKLDRLNDNPNAQIMKYLQSHPLSIERVSNTRNLARTLGNQGRENSSYLYAREKIRALTRRTGRTAMSMSTIKNPVVKNYATAMDLYYQGKISQSYNVIAQLPQQQAAIRLALATLLNDQGDYQQAFNLLSRAADVKPSDTALLVPLSNALLGLGRTKEAWQRLRRVVPSEQTSLRFFELKQEVARRLAYHADAYIAAAERNVRMGEYRHAILQLKQAQKLPSITANGRAKVTAKLNQIEAQYGHQQDEHSKQRGR